jgi:hypothetical protein
MTRMYRELSVWKRIDGKSAVRFRCLEDLATGHFCVQIADFYSLPAEASVASGFDHQFVELLVENDPAERNDWFSTPEEAIRAHEEEFRSMTEAIVSQEKGN